ncbi:MAG: zinc-binding dehydrogenase [Chloroflexi bacterium]|nr:zinc-binding dehydrogenase [Chloroflexota bacterium]
MKTKAVVFTAPGQVAFQDIEMPDPGPDEVQIRTTYSTVSVGTEGWAFQDLFTWQPTPYPCVPGYQRVGVIELVGRNVKGWKPGDKVMATTGVWDGPVKPHWGSHMAVGNTRASELYRIPAGADEVDAAGTVVAQVGYNAAYRAVLSPGDWVVVYGDGIIGQSAAQAARSRGARVILVGHRAERVELAAAYSADAAFNARVDDVVSRVKALTGGKPVTAVLDTVQKVDAQRQYMALLENGRGQIVYSGFTPGTTWADMGLLQQRELTTHYVSGWNRARMEATLQLMADGKMRLRPLVTHLMPCQDAPSMYRMTVDKTEPFLGITFQWF